MTSAVSRLPANTPATMAMPKFSVSPVDSMTYCTLSAIGAMKVSEVTGGGIEIVGAEIAGGEPAGGDQQADRDAGRDLAPGDAGTAHARTQR